MNSIDDHQSLELDLNQLDTLSQDVSLLEAFEADGCYLPSDARRRNKKYKSKHNINSPGPSKFQVNIRKALSEYDKTDRSKRPITLPSLDRLYDIVGPECTQLIKNRLYHNND